MPFVFSDKLRNEILKMFEEAEKHTTEKEEKATIASLITRIKKMPKWRAGQRYSD